MGDETVSAVLDLSQCAFAASGKSRFFFLSPLLPRCTLLVYVDDATSAAIKAREPKDVGLAP